MLQRNKNRDHNQGEKSNEEKYDNEAGGRRKQGRTVIKLETN